MSELIKKLGDAIVSYPKSWDDYVGIGRWLIYKKLLIILCLIFLLAVIVLIIVIIWLLRPVPPPSPEPVTVPVFSHLDEALMLYSGEAIIVDGDERVLYRGQVTDGLRSGWGQEYTPPNVGVHYEGGFELGFYSGQGRLYGQGGEPIYEGGFVNGMYDGSGILYDGGGIKYRGGFSLGQYQGLGTLYEDGLIRYEGEFAGGMYDGEGVEYDDGGHVIYTGGFVRGKREGSGLETDAEGNPIYSGSFRAGAYDGEGILYTLAGARLRFEGSFFNGKPGREGKIYNSRGHLLYDGAVFMGDVDCIRLIGLDIADWLECIKEEPIVYYGSGFVGFLFPELGVAGIGYFETNAQYQMAIPSEGIVMHSAILEGSRYLPQIPTGGAAASWKHLNGFEALMGTRLAAVREASAKLEYQPEIVHEGGNVYRAEGLPLQLEFDGSGVYFDLVFYIVNGSAWQKGGTGVIYCRKAEFGG